jgi:hypothetical protein
MRAGNGEEEVLVRRVPVLAAGLAVALALAGSAGAANPVQTLKRQVTALQQRVTALEAVVSCLDSVRPVVRFGLGDEGYVYAYGEQYVVTTGLDGVNDVSGYSHVVYLAEMNPTCVQGAAGRRAAGGLRVNPWVTAASSAARTHAFRLARIAPW